MCTLLSIGGSEPTPNAKSLSACLVALTGHSNSSGVGLSVRSRACYAMRYDGLHVGWNQTKQRKAEECGIATVNLFSEKDMTFTRITVNPKQMGGVPCIHGLRIPVATVVGMIADGMTETEILGAYPDLEVEDIHEALQFATEAVRDLELPLAVL